VHLNVLLSSSNNKIPLLHALMSAVKRIDPNGIVTAGDADANVISKYVAHRFWHMPTTTDENIEAIIHAIKEQKITHILPSRDGELVFWARLKPQLASLGIIVIVSEPDVVSSCLDKLVFGSLPYPNIIKTSDTIDAIASEHYVVKERVGSGSTNIGLNLNYDEALQHACTLKTPVFQPYHEGLEISVDAWLSKQHKVKAMCCRVRELVVNGESQITQSLPNCPYETQFIKLLENLRLEGPVVLQAIITHDNQPLVIECNSRFGGASTLGLQAGVDSLFWSLQESIGTDVDSLEVSMATHSIRQIRIPKDLYI